MRAVALAASLVAMLMPAAPAAAKLPFQSCGGFGFGCARMNVPLDRSGALEGRVSLYVKRLPARHKPARGATFLLAGGPGQSATDAFSGDALGLFAPSFRRNQLIVYDQRGTGRSGVLRCLRLQRTSSDAPGLGADCARRLGARRAFYTTRDSVEDIEAIRRRLGVAKITLIGTSYGTKVALAYALSYPQSTERLVLDSVVEATGPNPFYLESFAAVPRVLSALCDPGCAGFAPDPVAQAAQLVAAMASGPLHGKVVDARGKARPARLSRSDLFDLLIAGDLDPTVRAGFPGAVAAAVAGDSWPLMRLARRAAAGGEAPPAGVLSAGLYAATSCEETLLPWPRATPPDPAERDRLAAAALAGVADAALAPFDRATALRGDLIRLCGAWPQSPLEPALGPGPLPDVPVLLLAGGQDLRTPVESAQRVAALFGRAALVVVPRAGHSVFGNDLSGCATRAFEAFFADRPVDVACRRGRELLAPDPPPPTSLAQVPPAPNVAGRAGRVLKALELTLTDVQNGLLAELFSARSRSSLVRGGGLRGGSYEVTTRGLRMHRVAFVPGVRVSGFLREDARGRPGGGTLRISGPGTPKGTLRFRGERVSGRIGGQRVRARYGPRPSVAAARTTVARLPDPTLGL